MKVLITSVDFFPNIGGISTMTWSLTKALSEWGADVTLMTPFSKPPILDDLSISYVHDSADGIAHLEGRIWRQDVLPKLTARLRDLHVQRGFDHVLATHLHYYGQGWAAIETGQRPPLSIVCHGFELRRQLLSRQFIHDLKLQAFGQGPSLRRDLTRALDASDYVFCNSDYTSGLAAQLSCNTQMVTIGCGIDESVLPPIERFQPQAISECKADARRALGIDPDLKYVGFLGRLAPHKNVETILQVLHRLPSDCHAIIVGDGSAATELKLIAERLSLSERVIWCGQVPENEKWDWLRAMNLSYLLSGFGPDGQVEGFGIAALESNSVGTPVIVGNIGGTGAAIIDGKTGYRVSPNNINEIVKLSARILEDPIHAAELTRNAREDIGNRLTWQKIAQSILRTWKH